MTDRRVITGAAGILTLPIVLAAACAAAPAPAQEPDPYNNVPGLVDVLSVCDHGNRVYESTSRSQIRVIPDDRSCPGTPLGAGR